MILPPVFVNFFGAITKDKFNLADVKAGCTDLKDHLNDARKEAKDEDKVKDSARIPHANPKTFFGEEGLALWNKGGRGI